MKSFVFSLLSVAVLANQGCNRPPERMEFDIACKRAPCVTGAESNRDARSPQFPDSLDSLNTATGSSGANPLNPVATSYPDGRGAAVPFQEFQAEDGQTNARIIGPDRTRYDVNHIEAEAIGRKAVRLEKVGDYVSIKASKAGNSVVVRLSIPDSPSGGGIDSTIGVYINGKRKSLKVTSRYSWVYEGEAIHTPNNPSGGAHAFFDEAHMLTDSFQAGAEIKIQKDAEDSAAFYVIDLIDLEQVAAPLQMPNDLVSITDFGAVPDDDVDDGIAIQTAIDKLGETGKKGIWIPAGVFIVKQTDAQGRNLGISAKGIQIRGAGMWYSTLRGMKASMFCWGEGGCAYSDFMIDGQSDRRDDNNPNNGFNGGLGKGTSVANVWVEHTKAGMWIGTDADKFGTDGLVVRNSRFRNIYADGINFDNGTRNSIAENNHFRNTGDDAMAMWSYKGAGDRPNDNNVFRHNTVQMPWRANCFAIYGGGNNRVEDSVCEDVLTYAGIMVSNDFNAHPFTATTSIKNMTLIRAGGLMFNQQWGAITFNTPQGPVSDIAMENIDIVDATYSGLEFNGSGMVNNVSLKDVKVRNSGTFGILTNNNVQGNVRAEGLVVSGSLKGPYDRQNTPESFFTRGPGNEGW